MRRLTDDIQILRPDDVLRGYVVGVCFGTLRMLAERKVDPRPLITGTVGLDGVAGAFADLEDAERHAKILIDPALAAAG